VVHDYKDARKKSLKKIKRRKGKVTWGGLRSRDARTPGLGEGAVPHNSEKEDILPKNKPFGASTHSAWERENPNHRKGTNGIKVQRENYPLFFWRPPLAGSVKNSTVMEPSQRSLARGKMPCVLVKGLHGAG